MKILLLGFTVLFSLTVFSQNALSESQKAFGKRLNSPFNLKIKSGLTFASASVQYDSGALREDNQSVEFNKESSLRFGLEAEFIFPYTNKWSVFIEPTYTSYNSKQEVASAIDESNLSSVEIDYRFIEVPLGLRHHIYFGRSKVFLNAAIVFVFNIDGIIDYEEDFEFSNDLDIKSDLNLAFGFGYSFNERISIEYRLATRRNVLAQYASYRGPFDNSSLVIGFRLF